MRFSSRVDISEPNPIAKAEAEAKANGITLGKLNDSNPTKHALASELLPDIYGAEPRGQRYAREALAAFLHEQGNTATADDLYILSSTSEAYSWLIKLLCNAGDAVLAPKPGYPLIESIARLECVDMIEYQQRFDGSWYIDVAELREALEGEDGGRIRALVLINPNNPTGSYVKALEREAIVRLCHDHEVAIIADEVFYDYDLEPFDGNARLAGETGTLTFALDGFSKTLAAPHAKVGWIQVSGPAAEVDEAKRRLDVVADDYLPMSEIIAKQIPAMLGAAAAQTARVRERVQTNLAALHTMLDDDEQGMVSVLRAEGGWNVLLRVPSVLDENELVLSMIEKHGISGQPGYFFDMTSNGYLAISLLPEPDEFRHNVQTVLDTVNTMIG
ncbi:pyridoxal phosphate-dependent aminotransferase [Bifidobacterium pseudocatenulatum]|uniref:pyridoxal phosphate-dependent aminotransferase n=1 Tax=Bifidobacterium pseudocatenulatum TaxID=28026 RepID=UPI00080BAE0F|nr:pyridoxal phosphate-dependent aminotransferase [Bifidobacterium pseudocatenulatum]AZN75582.1 pyridoxal phosphate-dependent aminotransferase [Bifidobacterium pseudocatenulatum]MCB4887492.1 pyridoxal phosphate-dependent aminotransferase [Bifidobacterium pseudocatenulatum]MCB4900084.1 pyridoxal phosphate-dependent aminotransferase [Bifidobacterium pseudocatenulatum]MDB6509964.1 pyridoxal phosphate-dependent aminotransferase [Bifidobacterium pseudocatenulatum]MDB6513540.1 pyridoxal phosphate-de